LPGLISLRSLSTRTRFVLAAAVACLPLLALVAYAAVDRYDADRARAVSGAANRAELFATLLGQTDPVHAPSNARLTQLLQLSPLPEGSALVVLAGNKVQARAGPASAGPPITSANAKVLSQRNGTFYAKGADGIQRVWGLAPVEGGSLAVAYGRPGASIYGPARTALERDIALAVAATLAALLAAFLIGGRVTAPLRRLAARVGTGGADELGAIELGFQTLGEAVAEGEASLARHAERLATLHSIDRAILDAETPEEVARAALGRLRKFVGAGRASIVLFDRERQRARTFAVVTHEETRLPSGSDYELDAVLFPAEELLAGRAAVHPDLKALNGSKGLVSSLLGDGIRSYTALPLIAGRELLGSVTLGFTEPGAPSDEILAVATEVADQLAIALHQSRLHTELQAVLDATLDAIIVLDYERRIVTANEAATRILGRTQDELAGARADGDLLVGWDDARWRSFIAAGSFEDVFKVERADGQREVEARGRAEFLAGRHLLLLRDVTERRRLESDLRQSQKMEAIGQFAGGVAHDFNNLLTAVAGFGAIARRKIAGGPGAVEVEQVERAAERATQLTNQLLAFARQQIVKPVAVDLGEVVSAVMPMLSRLIGEDIETVLIADETRPILADRGQLEQVIVNLAVNARDAMPTGGTLTIEVQEETMGPGYVAEHAGVQPGSYVCLTVTDTGSGIDAETRQHLFEPFFTTKEQGQGTGLGLATVHGIVTQSGGNVSVYSEPDMGTSFKVYLPVTQEAVTAAGPTPLPSLANLGGTETILLCEDEELVRMYVEEILREAGYNVVPATRPSEAIELAAQSDRPTEIELLVTDIVMPQMSGPELAERLQKQDPGLSVLFLSGYSAETVRERGGLPLESAFLEKPFDDVSLLRSVRGLLDRSRESASTDSLL